MQNPSSTGSRTRRWLILALSLIALSTVLFVAGIAIERGSTALLTSTHQAGPGETSSADSDGGHDETSASGNTQSHISEQTVFGLDLENPWAVGTYVVIWLALAVALLRFGRLAWAALLLVSILAGVLDVGEVGRQWSSTHVTIATFAVLVMLAHVALAVLALFILIRSRRESGLSLS